MRFVRTRPRHVFCMKAPGRSGKDAGNTMVLKKKRAEEGRNRDPDQAVSMETTSAGVPHCWMVATSTGLRVNLTRSPSCANAGSRSRGR